MHRRQAIKLLAAAGAGTMAVGGFSLAAAVHGLQHPSENASWYLITSDPRGDLKLLRDALGIDSLEAYRLSTVSIEPSGQDLTVLHTGDTGVSRIVDPSISMDATRALRDLTHELRRRRTPGTTLLSIESARPARRKEITFEIDGRIVDVVPSVGTWNRIEIEGHQGRTVFRLDADGLRVTSSSCRHELCRRSNAQRHGSIICAPNRLVAYMPASSTGLSAITG